MTCPGLLVNCVVPSPLRHTHTDITFDSPPDQRYYGLHCSEQPVEVVIDGGVLHVRVELAGVHP